MNSHNESSHVITHLIREIVFRMRSGPHTVWRWIRDRQNDARLDRQFGIASTESSESQDTIRDPECVRYQPVSYRDLRQILDTLSIGSEDVFLDFGSGMGRAICVAAIYPFRSVVGVEISPELCAIARQNIERIRPKMRCCEIEVVNARAQAYEIAGEVSVIYFFNPFHGTILSRVLDNIAQSLQRSPRHIRLVFYGTVSSDGFRAEAAQHKWLRLDSETRLFTGAVALVYSNCSWTEVA